MQTVFLLPFPEGGECLLLAASPSSSVVLLLALGLGPWPHSCGDYGDIPHRLSEEAFGQVPNVYVPSGESQMSCSQRCMMRVPAWVVLVTPSPTCSSVMKGSLWIPFHLVGRQSIRMHAFWVGVLYGRAGWFGSSGHIRTTGINVLELHSVHPAL